jgi:membrane-associated phospholipid phosphatase
MVARRVVALGLLCLALSCYGTTNKTRTARDAHLHIKNPFKKKTGHLTYAGRAVTDLIKDVLILNKNLIHWDSFKVIAATFPLFIGGRMLDHDLQNCFYERSCHKNIHQMPHWCATVAKYSLAIPIVFWGSSIFWSRDEDFRQTSRAFLLGVPFVIYGKNLLKKWQFEACKRPWNEHFSRTKQAYGGFPSGHMAEITYATVLYGVRQGPKLGVPLGLVSLFLGISFVNCNRHYLSQIVAGAGLGTMYALAASKLVDEKLANLAKNNNLQLGMGISPAGGPELQLSFDF